MSYELLFIFAMIAFVVTLVQLVVLVVQKLRKNSDRKAAQSAWMLFFVLGLGFTVMYLGAPIEWEATPVWLPTAMFAIAVVLLLVEGILGMISRISDAKSFFGGGRASLAGKRQLDSVPEVGMTPKNVPPLPSRN